MDRFEDMQTFVSVVETGSMSAAAERLGVAKSVVSRRISELEGRLGAQLIHRTTRRLSLTDAGRGYYERSLRILADLEEAEAAVSEAQATLKGRLRVAVPLSFGLAHLGPAIVDFVRAHPQVEFDLDFNDRQVDLLREGFDLAIRIARLPDSTLIARRLAPIRHVVCAAPAHLAAHGTPETPEQLARHACLAYSNAPDPGVWRYRAPDGREGVVRLPVRLRASNGDFLREAAIAGLGVIMEPSFIVHRSLERGELRVLLPGHQWPALDAYAVYPQTRHLSRRVRRFVDFLVARFAGTPYWDVPCPPAGPASPG